MRALILVDIQNDFCPGGALAVEQGDEVVAVANTLSARADFFDTVIATQDFHPADHGSFASSHPGTKVGDVVQLGGVDQYLWPDHCVSGTAGAHFHPSLDLRNVAKVFPKGVDPSVDSYSGFFDNGRMRDTGLSAYLHERSFDEIWILGLATDYCVKATALDARSLGFKVVVVPEGCRGVNVRPDDSRLALAELAVAGCVRVDICDIR